MEKLSKVIVDFIKGMIETEDGFQPLDEFIVLEKSEFNCLCDKCKSKLN